MSDHSVNLLNWKISNGRTVSVIRKPYLLDAGSLPILCPAAAEAGYTHYGPALGLTAFPVLNQNAGEIILTAETGMVIHAVSYDKSWYHNELKSAGGWSLEMIDAKNPCSGYSNWTSSENPDGGTPGQLNSVAAENPDREAPELLRSITEDSTHLILLFSEPLDSLSASDVSNYNFLPDLGYAGSAVPIPPFYDRLSLTLGNTLLPQATYVISAEQVRDCAGNSIGLQNHCKAGLPQPAREGDLIFNEILFNPPSGGFDYIELFNRSSKVTDLHKIFLAGRDALDKVKDPKRLDTGSQLFFPGEYAVFSENPEWTSRNFTVQHPEKLFGVTDLPSMPDDQGTILLLNETGTLLDELPYDHHWHSPLIGDEAGVALERMSADQPTALPSNWTSAAAAAGYGTPTSKNSEAFSDTAVDSRFSLEPKIFSPDNDGYQDFCFVKYQQLPGGFTGSISIYDIRGRPVRQLANNISLGAAGSFRWDGLDDSLNPLPMGHYIVCADLFSLTGKIKKYRLVVTLAKKN